METLNIIGAGNVGKTLGYLLAKNNSYQIQDILCRSLIKAIAATHFIGTGRPIADYNNLRPANVTMISVTDDELPRAISSLLATPSHLNTGIVFHCSGAFSHEILLPLKTSHSSVASIHPIKSFSLPIKDCQTFQGTYCTLEGEAIACEQLKEKFESIGGSVLPLKTNSKMLYHIATIFSSNYFIALLDTSLMLFEKIGISRTQGIQMIEPLVLGTFQQVKKRGTDQALTGPIARGDVQLVKQQIELLKKEAEKIVGPYQELGKLTLQLTSQVRSINPLLAALLDTPL
jgi:predicted short-subunit dehydrogenase-like oxidoreductase (DUF2520 family)